MMKAQSEQLEMKDGETIAHFNNRLVDIVNESDLMGNTISEEEPVKKIHRSLPKSYDGKVAATKESADLKTMTLLELMGSPKLFESMLNKRKSDESKQRSVALKSIVAANYEEEEKLSK